MSVQVQHDLFMKNKIFVKFFYDSWPQHLFYPGCRPKMGNWASDLYSGRPSLALKKPGSPPYSEDRSKIWLGPIYPLLL